MYMEAYSAVTYLGVHVLVDLCPVEHGSIVLVDVDSSHSPCVRFVLDKSNRNTSSADTMSHI